LQGEAIARGTTGISKEYPLLKSAVSGLPVPPTEISTESSGANFAGIFGRNRFQPMAFPLLGPGAPLLFSFIALNYMMRYYTTAFPGTQGVYSIVPPEQSTTAPTTWHATGEHKNAATVPMSRGVAHPTRKNCFLYSYAGLPG